MATTIYGGVPTDLVNDPTIGPAGKLYTPKFHPPDTLTYPLDVGREHRKHSVVFKVFEILPFFESVATYNGNSGWQGEGDTDQNQENQSATIAQKIKEEAARGLTFNSRTRDSAAATVALYMPDTLNFTNNAQYDNLSVGKALENTTLPLVGRVAKAITSVVGGEGLVRAGLNRLGYVFNPQQQLLFEGIDFRTFDFSFTFTPRSAKEAAEIKKIVKVFRKYSLPTINDGAAGFFFTPPSVFEIQFLSGDKINTNLPLIKRCVVETVDVNYAPNGWSAHVDGAPVQTTMQMRVKEIILVDSKQVDGGY
jgi:hypothetical protein